MMRRSSHSGDGRPGNKEHGIKAAAGLRSTPYDLFQSAIAAGVKPTIHDCWSDFARWEMARDFADDPSHPAKAAIAWIDTMELLRADLDEFAGLAKNECREALDRAYDAFARLEHSPELVRAIELWRESRLAE